VIVVDASAAAEMLLGTPEGLAIAEELLTSEESLHAPHLLDAEVLSALRKGWLRGLVSAERAQAALDDLADLPIERHAHELLLERAWVLKQAVSACDALYLALAELLEAPLVTRDARLTRCAGHGATVLLR
jgi:predicted nucleic acid-binding protein